MVSAFVPQRMVSQDPRSISSSVQVVDAVQGRFGTVDYSQWSVRRGRKWGFVDYPEAGSTSLSFFGQQIGQNGVTVFDTNMQTAGKISQEHFLVKSISAVWRINTWALTSWAGTNISTLVSDVLAGFVQGGFLRLTINTTDFLQLPLPFLHAPDCATGYEVWSAGIEALTLTEGTPNTLATYTSDMPWVTVDSARENLWKFDPMLLIAAEQTFSVSIEYPSGAVPVIGTTITDDTTNPLQVGIILDGELLRPLAG